MAKQNWEALQTQFLAAHAETGVSPKEWCEAQGLKYSTAKEFIRIKPRKPKPEKQIPNSGNKKPNSGSSNRPKSLPSKPRNESIGSEGRDSCTETKRNRRSGNPVPSNPFPDRNTAALRHGGYARRMLIPDDVLEDAAAMELRHELILIRSSNLIAAESVGRLIAKLEDENDIELKKIITEDIHAAENAMHRNIARIESLERTLSGLDIDRYMLPKIAADTEFRVIATKKSKAEIEKLSRDLGIGNALVSDAPLTPDMTPEQAAEAYKKMMS